MAELVKSEKLRWQLRHKYLCTPFLFPFLTTSVPLQWQQTLPLENRISLTSLVTCATWEPKTRYSSNCVNNSCCSCSDKAFACANTDVTLLVVIPPKIDYIYIITYFKKSITYQPLFKTEPYIKIAWCNQDFLAAEGYEFKA